MKRMTWLVVLFSVGEALQKQLCHELAKVGCRVSWGGKKTIES
jgi:hypothetical protein